MDNHYLQLAGLTITGLVKDDSDDKLIYGLKLSDGKIAWILQDPEGNGPGFLDITQ